MIESYDLVIYFFYELIYSCSILFKLWVRKELRPCTSFISKLCTPGHLSAIIVHVGPSGSIVLTLRALP